LELLAAGSLACTLLGLFATQYWVFELFTHFRVQIVIGQSLLLACLVLVRKPRWTPALLVGIAVNIFGTWPYLAPTASFAAHGTTLRVGLANVQSRNTHGDGLIAAMGDAAPDILAIVEYNDAWAMRLAPLLADYPYRVELPQDDNFGIAFFSREPIHDSHAFDLDGNPAIEVHIEHDGAIVRVVAVHLTPPMSAAMAAQRQRQLGQLEQRIAANTEPLVVIGDFNLSPYSPYFPRFLARSSLHDARAGHGLAFTWPAFMPLLGIPIDHCLTSSHWLAVNYRRLPAYGSDHHAIVVDLASSTRS
jgi:endonuclease/exonuclease/phosphatase (EEP) superfamily protein YafD